MPQMRTRFTLPHLSLRTRRARSPGEADDDVMCPQAGEASRLETAGRWRRQRCRGG